MINATKFVGDVEVEKILLGTCGREMTVRWISVAYGIPPAVCYRKVLALLNGGLLTETRAHLCRDGKIIKFYRANLEKAYVHYDDGRIKIRLKVVLNITKEYRKSCEALARRSSAELRIIGDSWLGADISDVRDIQAERKRR